MWLSSYDGEPFSQDHAFVVCVEDTKLQVSAPQVGVERDNHETTGAGSLCDSEESYKLLGSPAQPTANLLDIPKPWHIGHLVLNNIKIN